MTRSLHVITSDQRRGAETFAVQLSSSLENRGEVVRLVALRPSREERPHSVAVLGRSRRDPRGLWALRRRAQGADVVVAHGSATLEACTTALVGLNIPLFYRAIGDPHYWVDDRRRRAWIGALLRRTTRVIALWEGAATRLRTMYGLPANQISVIPNGVPGDLFNVASAERRADARRTLGIESGGPHLAVVGALSPEKQVDVAIRAVASHPKGTLVIAGSGPDRTSLEQLATRIAPGQVHFLGSVDPRQIYAASDLLLLPSRSEGMPAVVIEAALMGTPTVAYGVGALPEMLTTGATGHLAPPNDPAAFGRAIDAALNAPISRSLLAETFRERYSMESVTTRWIETIHRVPRS